jgi:AcrR family transcriptional regulator
MVRIVLRVLADRPTGAALPIAGERTERRDAAENRRRILEAAREVLARRGAAGMSMEAVAREAGVGKATVFRRFGDRAGLTQALIVDYMGAFQDGFLFGPPPLGPGAEAADRLEAFLVELVRVHLAHLDLAVAHDVTPGAASAPVYATLLLHAAILLREVAPDADERVLAGYLISAVAPGVLLRMRQQFDVRPGDLEDAARRLVRGLR